MILRSKLRVLLELDLLSLLAVQNDVTRLIEEKVVLLEDECRNGRCVQPKDENKLVDLESPTKRDSKPSPGEDSDEDDFLLTQFDQIVREKLLSKGNEAINNIGVEAISKKPDLSSPLKGTQSLPDSLGSLENDLHIFPPKVQELKAVEVHGRNVLQQSNCRVLEQSPNKRRRMNRTRSDSRLEQDSVVSLNINPVTEKPWILEDFKLNEDMNSVRRGRKKLSTVKLNNFYEQGGRPPDVGVAKESTRDFEDENNCEFENLRHRSKSPPGFGRLDFPNTQERVDDKKKSQEIIHKKTKRRFLAAVCREIPQQERQFLFKSEYLNRLVEDGNFEWDDKNLRIFTRR